MGDFSERVNRLARFFQPLLYSGIVSASIGKRTQQAQKAKREMPRLLPEDEMVRRAIAALMEKLGPIETARFLTLPRARLMSAVLRHRKWQAGLDKDRFFDQVFGKETRA